MTFLADWIQQTWQVLLQAGPWLVGGFLLAGVIYVLVPVEKVTRHLGKPGLAGVLKAALIGAPLPLCSCSVIPVAAAIRRQGATRGATASFLVSAPETGVDSFVLSWAMLGPFMAIVRPIAALITAFAAGLAIDRLDPGTEAPAQPSPDPAPTAGGHCCCHAKPETAPPRESLLKLIPRKVATAVRYGFGTMFEDLAHWLLLGFLLAGLVSAIVPTDALERYIGSGPRAMLIMLLVGLPMYVCATSSTPVAAVLIAKGLSPGAALVFLLAGPATNVATMVVVARDLGKRSLAIYLASIAVVALAFGLLTDLVLSAAPTLNTSIQAHVCAKPPALTWPFAVLLMLLILNGLRMRITKRLAAAQARRAMGAAPTPVCCEHH